MAEPKGFVSHDEVLKRRPITPEARTEVEEIKRDVMLEHGLHELRELTGLTQTAIAERMETSRPNVYRIEHETDVRLSTLQRYVGALGGSLVLEAVLPGGERVSLLSEVPKAETDDLSGDAVPDARSKPKPKRRSRASQPPRTAKPSSSR
jgi:transcriptional regulator with XRE-family HTH domain